MSIIPRLRVRSVPLPTLPILDDFLTTPKKQFAWLKENDGLIGVGNVARLDYKPTMTDDDTTRFNQAAQWWQAIETKAEIYDEVGIAGSGLVAFGSFSYAPHSPAGTILCIPQLIVGRKAKQAWITFITKDDEQIPADLCPEAQRLLTALEQAEKISYNPPKVQEITQIPKPIDWMAQVSEITKHIRSGQVDKVVLSRSLKISTEYEIDERAIISNLHANYPSTHVFAIDGLIGATPEMLVAQTKLKLKQPEITCRVLAGTLPTKQSDITLGSSLADDRIDRQNQRAHTQLQASPKDQLEHQVAVNSVVQTLSQIADVHTNNPYVLELPNVLHLATDINATLHNNYSLIDVAGLLHPTAALGGSPKATALQIINELEVSDRDRYGAPVGWIGSGNVGQWCVALRCARIDSPNSARAWAGGGIMGDSISACELAETEAKFAPILNAFNYTN